MNPQILSLDTLPLLLQLNQASPLEAAGFTPPIPLNEQSVLQEDIQATFASIKASVSNVRLPADLSLGSSGASGLKKGDAHAHTLINKVARITETILKLLKSKEDPYNDIFSCLLALMRFLQDEQAALLVQSSPRPNCSKILSKRS